MNPNTVAPIGVDPKLIELGIAVVLFSLLVVILRVIFNFVKEVLDWHSKRKATAPMQSPEVLAGDRSAGYWKAEFRTAQSEVIAQIVIPLLNEMQQTLNAVANTQNRQADIAERTAALLEKMNENQIKLLTMVVMKSSGATAAAMVAGEI